jgi:hypothetical protein
MNQSNITSNQIEKSFQTKSNRNKQNKTYHKFKTQNSIVKRIDKKTQIVNKICWQQTQITPKKYNPATLVLQNKQDINAFNFRIEIPKLWTSLRTKINSNHCNNWETHLGLYESISDVVTKIHFTNWFNGH